MATWRALVPSLLEWMTPLLTAGGGAPRPGQPGRQGARIAQGPAPPGPGQPGGPRLSPRYCLPACVSAAAWCPGVEVEHPGVQHGPLVQRRAERAVQAVFQVELAAPLDDVREQVTVEGGVLGQQQPEVQHRLGGDQLVEPDRARRHLRPLPCGPGMVGIGSPFPDLLEDHGTSLVERSAAGADAAASPRSWRQHLRPGVTGCVARLPTPRRRSAPWSRAGPPGEVHGRAARHLVHGQAPARAPVSRC